MLLSTSNWPPNFKAAKIVKNSLIWPCILIAEVLNYSSYGIFVNLSRIGGDLKYQSSSMWFTIELFKFATALVLAWPELVNQGLHFTDLKSILPFSIPALCYCINNNLSVFMQDEMDPATFQVLCNLKIASTAILYRLIVKRKLRTLQWISLGVLTFAGVLNSHYGLRENSRSLQDIHISVSGIIMTALYCTVSGFAGVYTEYILKKDEVIPLSLQNCFMYSFGLILNGLLMLYQSDKQPIFHGFTKYTWAAVVSQALNGLCMSFIMKYSSNITRLFVISSAVPVAAMLSVVVFGTKLGFEFVVIVILVVLALSMYNYPQRTKSLPSVKQIL